MSDSKKIDDGGHTESPVYRSDDLVAIPRGLIGAACSAIRNKAEAHNVLRQLREVARAPAISLQSTDAEDDRDYQRGAEADFLSHVSHLRQAREWE